jgi:hypothetical protein
MRFRRHDIIGSVQDTYSTASDRIARATAALRGNEDSHFVRKAVAILIGMGVGVGIGLLIAPTSDEKMRNEIADRLSDIRAEVREQVNPEGSTGLGEQDVAIYSTSTVGVIP